MFGIMIPSLKKRLAQLKRQEVYICGDLLFYQDLQHEHIEQLRGKKVILTEESAILLSKQKHRPKTNNVIHFKITTTFQFLRSVKETIELSVIPFIDERQLLKEKCEMLQLNYDNIDELSLAYYQLWKDYKIGTPIFFTANEQLYKKASKLDIVAYLYNT